MNIWLAEIWRAWRASLRRPGFVLLAIGVLALGIGASVAVFTLIDQVLLQPLPVPQPNRLVVLRRLGKFPEVGALQYQHMQGLPGVTSLGLAGLNSETVNIAGGRRRPELVHVLYANRGLLPTLGIQPLLGRNFSAMEDSPQGPPVVILTHRFWQRQFGGAHDVIGRTLRIKGVTHTIVGVLPKSFAALGFEGAIVLPMALPPDDRSTAGGLKAVARLSGSSSLAVISAELDARMHAVDETITNVEARNTWLRFHFGAERFRAFLHAADLPVLGLFLVCALFVLAIALVNLTNLMVVRTLSRSHDVAVRNALGAPLFRRMLPSLAEGLLVGMGGAILGVVLAFLGLHLFQRFIPGDWLNGSTLRIGAVAVGLAFVIGVLGTVLAVGIGLWRGRMAEITEELSAGGRSGISRHGHRLGRALVVLQVVLATALLCTVGLFLHTLYDVERAPLGFTPGNILTFEMKPLKTAYPNAVAMDLLTKRLTRRLEEIPGVSRASATTNLPSGGLEYQLYTDVHAPGGQPFESEIYGVGPGFFHVFGIHLREGRLFTAGDVRGSEKVAIIDRAVADRYYGGHAVGKLLLEPGARSGARIVGVVDNTSQEGASINHAYDEEASNRPTLAAYVPLAQMPHPELNMVRSFLSLDFALRVRGNPYGYRGAVERVVTLVAPGQPVARFRSMQDIVASATASLRLHLLLVGVFAVLALLLAAAGLYAVMTVVVRTREHEFGVRTALGATPGALLRMVLREGLVQLGIGLVLGVFLALGLLVTLRPVIEQLGSTHVFDPSSIVGACLVLIVVGLLACLLPALHAARIPPMHALREE